MDKFVRALNPPSEVLGLIATSDIEPGELIFKDSTPIGVSCQPKTYTYKYRGINHPQNRPKPKVYKPKCCDAKFCSRGCVDSARASYHYAICGKDFQWLEKSSAPSSEMAADYQNDGVMWLRILATCVQSGLHPLDHPLVAGLTPNHQGDENVPRRWSLANHLVGLHRILTMLGVDIFTDMGFDNWVLQTVWACLANNCSRGETELASRDLKPLYSFLKHCCDANAECKAFASIIPIKDVVSVKSSTRAIIAKRPIKKGEEIFISYLDEEKLLRITNKRRANLKWWLPGDCQCSRCLGKSSYSQGAGEATSQHPKRKPRDEDLTHGFADALKRGLNEKDPTTLNIGTGEEFMQELKRRAEKGPVNEKGDAWFVSTPGGGRISILQLPSKKRGCD